MSLTIYKASAGSGKTFTLAATFIAHLISSEAASPHRHQLAVTFTNKATAEMKERILQHLYDLAHGTDEQDGFFIAVRQLVPPLITNAMIRQLSQRALHGIIHDYDHFHVTTIDSFFQSLLSNLAHELNLTASFKVEISDKEVIGKALTQMLEKVEPNSEQMQWIKAYIRERMGNDKAWSIEHELKELAQQIFKEDYMLHSHLLHQGADGGFELDTQTITTYKRQLNQLIRTSRTKLAERAQRLDDFIKDGMGYDNISNGERWYHRYIEKLADEQLPLKDISEPSATFCRAAEDATILVKKSLQKKGEFREMADEVQIGLKGLIDCYREAKHTTSSCLLSLGNLNPLWLLDAIQQEIERINQENNRILLAKTPLLFHELTGSNDTSFIFERAGTQYHHVMIDEFQDTSKLQWSNMRHLLVENMAQGNSCMLVGDVKQGIYRFRGGDWNALANFREGYDHHLNATIEIETLKTNFRSGEHIVDFNNHFFVAASQAVQQSLQEQWGDDDCAPSRPSPDIHLIYPTPDPTNDTHEVTQRSHNAGGFVRIQLTDGKSASDEQPSPPTQRTNSSDVSHAADAPDSCVEASLATQMLRLRAAGVPFRDMAILIRWNSQATTLLDYFATHHGHDSEAPIPLISEEAFLLGSSSAVQVIIHALRYVADPTYDIAREYIRRYCPANRWEEVHSLLCQWHRESYSGLPFYEVSCRLIHLFGLDRLPGQSPYIYTFLDALLAFFDDNAANVHLFLDYWDETLHRKAIPSTAIDGVRILTIHKSKGLAFHSVFLPYCDWKIMDKPDIRWVVPSQAPYNAIPLLPIKITKEADHSIYHNIYRQELFDAHVENLNIIYVAFTRARQNLLVWSDLHTPGVSTIVADAMASIGTAVQTAEDNALTTVYEFGAPSALECVPDGGGEDKTSTAPEANPLKYNSDTITLPFVHYEPHLVFRQSGGAQLFLDSGDDFTDSDSRELHRQTGVLLHLLMSSIECAADVDTQIDAFARHGIIPSTMDIAGLHRLINSRLGHPTAAQWFDGSWHLYRECTLIFMENGRCVARRPDRVMTRGNRDEGTDETIVVDFKFGRYHPEHRDQVLLYIHLLQRQGLSNVQGYLWYLYSGSIEEVQIEGEQ